MTLVKLLEFCKQHQVNVAIGFDNITGSPKVGLRSGMFWQIDHRVTSPEEFSSAEDWELMMENLLNAMSGEIERRRNEKCADLKQKAAALRYEDRLTALLQQYSNGPDGSALRYMEDPE